MHQLRRFEKEPGRRSAAKLLTVCHSPFSFEPPIYHKPRVSLSIFAREENLIFYWHLHLIRVNDHAILPPLNPGADCVSYPPVLHQINIAVNWNTRKAGGSDQWPSC